MSQMQLNVKFKSSPFQKKSVTNSLPKVLFNGDDSILVENIVTERDSQKNFEIQSSKVKNL